MKQIEHLFWYHPETKALQHETFTESGPMYTFMKDQCAIHNCNLHMWNLTTEPSYAGWYSSSKHNGTTHLHTNMYVAELSTVPADIKLLCLLLNLDWR